MTPRISGADLTCTAILDPSGDVSLGCRIPCHRPLQARDRHRIASPELVWMSLPSRGRVIYPREGRDRRATSPGNVASSGSRPPFCCHGDARRPVCGAGTVRAVDASGPYPGRFAPAQTASPVIWGHDHRGGHRRGLVGVVAVRHRDTEQVTRMSDEHTTAELCPDCGRQTLAVTWREIGERPAESSAADREQLDAWCVNPQCPSRDAS